MFSIVISVFNYDCTELVKELIRSCSVAKVDYEILVGNDCSTDPGTLAALERIGTMPHCRVLNEERNIGKAYMLYPNDSYINLTMACLAIKKGEADEAAEYLSKVKKCPEKTMNEGLVAYLKGDVEKAVKLVEQAQKQGVKQASMQLEEFKKIEKIKNK